jgi:hypothetical protein
MNSSEKNTILLIDDQIAQLQKMKEQLLKAKPLSEIVKDKPYLWVIDSASNKYYQFIGDNSNQIQLGRFGKIFNIGKSQFDREFRIASSCEFKQHIEYLKSKGMYFVDTCGKGMSGTNDFTIKEGPKKHMIDPTKCDFYMVTVTGEHGAKVRHTDYDVAIKEASRLAKKLNHKAWVTGVVAIVEPIQPEIQVKVITK